MILALLKQKLFKLSLKWPMTEASVTIKYGIICDDIRREDNGKLMILGVYGGAIIVPKIPLALGLASLLCLEATAPTKMHIKIRYALDGKVLAQGEGEYTIESVGAALMALPKLPVPIPKEGALALEAQFLELDWQTARSIPVRKRPT